MVKRTISLTELCDSITEEYEILGAKDRHASAASPIDESDIDSITFCSKRSEDALPMIRNSKAGIIICPKELNYNEDDYKDKTLILVSNPRLAFIEVMGKYFQERIEPGIHPSAVIDKDARIHPSVHIGPNSYVGKCEIGENTIIYGDVYIYSKVRIGKNVIIHAGAVVGAEGQAYERDKAGILRKFPQSGGVIIGDGVEISSNASIMRGTFDNTVIGEGTKMGNLCSIGHNVLIGKHCFISAQVGIAGSTRIGDYSWLAPGATVRNAIKIGKNVVIGLGSVVTKNIEDNCVAYGAPARVVRKQPTA